MPVRKMYLPVKNTVNLKLQLRSIADNIITDPTRTHNIRVHEFVVVYRQQSTNLVLMKHDICSCGDNRCGRAFVQFHIYKSVA